MSHGFTVIDGIALKSLNDFERRAFEGRSLNLKNSLILQLDMKFGFSSFLQCDKKDN